MKIKTPPVIDPATFKLIAQCLIEPRYPVFRHLQGSSLTAWTCKMGPVGCPETSIYNYLTLSNNPEDRRFHLNRRGSLKLQSCFLSLLPVKETGTHFIGDWVGPRSGLDGCGKSRPYRDYYFYFIFLFSLCTFIPACFCILIVLHVTFLSLLYNTHNTNIHVPGGIRTRKSASDWPQILLLDRSATWIGCDPRTVQPVASRCTD